MTIEFKINGNWNLPAQSGYQPGIFKGFEVVNAYGGMPVVRKTSHKPTVTVTATYEFGSYQDIQDWNTFWYTTLNEGANPFVAMLDVGEGLKQYEVQIAEGGVSVFNADVEYLAVQIEMVVFISVDIEFLSNFHTISAILPESGFTALTTRLPYITDPFRYEKWFLFEVDGNLVSNLVHTTDPFLDSGPIGYVASDYATTDYTT